VPDRPAGLPSGKGGVRSSRVRTAATVAPRLSCRHAPRRSVTPAASAAAQRVVEAAREFLAAGAASYIRGGTQLVADAERAGRRFAVSIVIPAGQARVELIPPSGGRTQLFAVAAGRVSAIPFGYPSPPSSGSVSSLGPPLAGAPFFGRPAPTFASCFLCLDLDLVLDLRLGLATYSSFSERRAALASPALCTIA